MIDVHCHLNFHSFADDTPNVVKRAVNSGVTHIVNVGTKLDSSQLAVDLAERYENLYAIVGIHPHHADKHDEEWVPKLRVIALSSKKVIGIGEVGMDYYSYASNGIVDPKVQKETFEAQIELASELGLPLQIHNRQAGEDVIEILSYHKNLLRTIPGMFHCFAASKEVLKAALNLGFYIGFDGNITYKGIAKGESVPLPELASFVPVDRLLVETDSPFLTPIPYRGQRNEPAHAVLVARFLAELKGISYNELEEAIYNSFEAIFGIRLYRHV